MFNQVNLRDPKLTKDQKRDLMILALSSGECVVEFTKVNGDLRTMPCTLNSFLIPSQPVNENKKNKKPNFDVLSVWCLDKQEWRSFRIDNVISVDIKKAEARI